MSGDSNRASAEHSGRGSEEHRGRGSEESGDTRSNDESIAEVRSRIAALLLEEEDDGNRVDKQFSDHEILDSLRNHRHDVEAAATSLVSLLDEDHSEAEHQIEENSDTDYLPDTNTDESRSEESRDGNTDDKEGDGDDDDDDDDGDGDDDDDDEDGDNNAAVNDQPYSRLKEDFDLVDILGKGGYGVVFLCKHKFDRHDYAIKRISAPVHGTTPMEVYALAELQHPHIVQYHQAWVEAYSKTGHTPPDSSDGDNDPDEQTYSEPGLAPPHSSDGENEEENQHDEVLYIQMQYCPGKFCYGDKDAARKHFLQILQGLSFMHEKKIAHCDLTVFNVLLDKANNARICDFGLAHFLSGAELVENIEIQPLESVELKAFRAPELLQFQNSITEKVDIYSLGVMAAYIFSLDTTTMGTSNCITELKSGKEVPLLLRDEPQEIKRIFFSMVEKEPVDRPQAAEVLDALTSKWAE